MNIAMEQVTGMTRSSALQQIFSCINEKNFVMNTDLVQYIEQLESVDPIIFNETSELDLPLKKFVDKIIMIDNVRCTGGKIKLFKPMKADKEEVVLTEESNIVKNEVANFFGNKKNNVDDAYLSAIKYVSFNENNVIHVKSERFPGFDKIGSSFRVDGIMATATNIVVKNLRRDKCVTFVGSTKKSSDHNQNPTSRYCIVIEFQCTREELERVVNASLR